MFSTCTSVCACVRTGVLEACFPTGLLSTSSEAYVRTVKVRFYSKLRAGTLDVYAVQNASEVTSGQSDLTRGRIAPLMCTPLRGFLGQRKSAR